LAASESFKVRFHDNEFSAGMLMDQETRYVKISAGIQQTHHLVSFEVFGGDNRRTIQLCLPDSAVSSYKKQYGSCVLEDEKELKRIFSQKFSESGADVREFFVSDASRRR
jgi:hypothetical protein